ncbi:MAG TPA: nuclear transport factor 2 family protein [Thermoanaerobaculia bacterium]|nr:nuclear transport factor 2 family protein [Thermoanaerobaculia bacterium]
MFHLVALLSTSLLAAPPPPPPAANDPAIVAVADAYVAAVLKNDTAAVVNLYTDDAMEMPPNAAAVKGRAALGEFYKKQMSGAKFSAFTLTHIESRSAGDFGYDVGTYQQTLTPTGAPAPVNDTGKYIVIVKKSGGKWRVAYVAYNSDLPPNPAMASSEHHH